MSNSDEISMQKRRNSGDNKHVVFLFYLLVDVSYSMANDIAELNRKILEFRDKFRAEPILEDVTRLSIISFSDDAKVEVPLGNFAEAHIPDNLLSPRGGTSFAAAFRSLLDAIKSDARNLKEIDKNLAKTESFNYYRPCVFFLTDGYPNPNDDWRNAFTELKESKNYPLFIPFGFRDASVQTLQQLVHPKAVSKLYLARAGANVGQILEEMLEAMLNSILVSAHSAFDSPKLEIPVIANKNVETQQFVGGDFLVDDD